MEYQNFELLVVKVKNCLFAGSKRDAINKSTGPFTAQQLYRLQGQFTGGSDRVKIISDLNIAKRILPMTAKDAEPVIKMGIYAGQKQDLIRLLAAHITDRENPSSRQLLVRSFGGADKSWVFRQLDEAGPYQGPPPVATAMGPGATVVASNIILTHPAGSHYYQDPISYVAQNAGTALFGGIMTANVPDQRPGVQTTVSYETNVQPQQFSYPQSGQSYPMQQPPVAASQPMGQGPHVTQPQPSLYPPVPTDGGYASAPPPAYTPVDPQGYPPAGASQYPPQHNIAYPPAGPQQNQELPQKMPIA